jgi:hypothetical protein
MSPLSRWQRGCMIAGSDRPLWHDFLPGSTAPSATVWGATARPPVFLHFHRRLCCERADILPLPNLYQAPKRRCMMAGSDPGVSPYAPVRQPQRHIRQTARLGRYGKAAGSGIFPAALL